MVKSRTVARAHQPQMPSACGERPFSSPACRKCSSGLMLRGGDVRIGRKIRGRVEADRRVAALVPADEIVVVERIDVRGGDVGVGRQIAGRVEQRVRIAAFLPADGLEMPERIDARRRDVGIVLQVVDVVEAVRRRAARSARTARAPRPRPTARKCQSGSMCAAATSGLAARYCARIECRATATRPSFQPDCANARAD